MKNPAGMPGDERAAQAGELGALVSAGIAVHV